MQEELSNKLKLTDKSEPSFFDKNAEYDFSKFSSIEEFAWDMDLQNKLIPIAKKLNLSQESIDLLLEIALEMAKKQKSAYEKDDSEKLNQTINSYSNLLNEDNELPSVNSLQMKQYMEVANGAYSDFASPKLKEILASTGLIYHPEVIKLFYKIGDLSQEDNLSHYGAPPIEELTPAQILYGTKN